MNAIVGIALTATSLVINIIGLAIPYWVYASSTTTASGISITAKAYRGLWSACISLSGVGESRTTCATLSNDDLDDGYRATRAMEILGMLIILVALVCVLLKQFAMKDQALLPNVGAICAIVAGVLMIIGTIIFATLDNVETSSLHAGFALCIISGVIGIVAGVLIYFASRGG